MTAADDNDIAPGLLVLQGNRLEDLLEVLLGWLARQPLRALEEEVMLVQSNGIAEWLKMRLAATQGVCAATRVELPARFLWRSYRAMLGRAATPARSPLDEGPLTWRLMRLLPDLAARPGYEPLALFLAGPVESDDGPAARDRAPDLARRLQLAQRLADLFDQYQVYRADWLDDWAAGRAVLAHPDRGGPAEPLPAEQRWQACLWQALVEDLRATADGVVGTDGDAEADPLAGVRSTVHRRFVTALAEGQAPQRPLPRRVVLFGHSHLPGQTLEALAALASRAQVILAVPNPSRYHWADTIEGRELLRAAYRRQPARGGVDTAALPLEDAHAQAHPLLAGWGRRGRDFLRLLDAFEERLGSHEAGALRSQLPRVDVYDDAPGVTLLQQLQARVRDGVPLAEHAEIQGPPLDAAAARVRAAWDRSVTFQVCHSPMRELEVLHDQLLQRLAEAPPDVDRPPAEGDRPLAPRDIVVMLPDIESAAPMIHAVFGQRPTSDPRHIPYEIADLRPRGRHPLLLALEWLLRITEQRCTAGELRELIEVPALARRFGLADDDRPVLTRWLAEAGVRWGLDADHRASLDLAACGEANTWAFGLRRMLVGYAAGAPSLDRDDRWVPESSGLAAADEPRPPPPGEPPPAPPWHDIEPYAEVAGLAAGIAGALAGLVERLTLWWREARTDATPAGWDARARALLDAAFDARADDERSLIQALHEALAGWRADCDEAGFDAPVPLAVLREAWLGRVAEPGVRSRFLSGGVTFCTLMPMRAIPFRVVALLGLNEGDYPRRAPRSDFDLMGLPGQRRPGDRARRDDDRMLMLEALLSAREALIVGWVGRSVRDQSPQPPSVLVGQLRDYLAAGWGAPLLEAITTEHPLQPFSRRYFEAAPGAGTVEAALSAGGVEAAPSAAGAAGATEAGGAQALFTHATEWRAIHAPTVDSATAADRPATVAAPDEAPEPLSRARLEAFLRNPVADHLDQRLGVRFDPPEAALLDDEPMGLDALEQAIVLRELVEQADHLPALPALPEAVDGAPALDAERDALAAWLEAGCGRLQREGRLPLAGLGPRWQRQFAAESLPMALALRSVWRGAPQRAEPQRLAFQHRPAGAPSEVEVDDWLDGLRRRPDGGLLWTDLVASRLCRPQTDKDRLAGKLPQLLPDKLLRAWLVMLLAGALGLPLRGVLVGRDACAELSPPAPDTARRGLQRLLDAWWRSQHAPLPVAPRSALAALKLLLEDKAFTLPADGSLSAAWSAEAVDAAAQVYDGSGWSGGRAPEREVPALARVHPDAESLLADLDAFRAAAEDLYGPLAQWSAAQTARLHPRSSMGDTAGADDEDDVP